MSDPFVAEIRIFPFGHAPSQWAHCDGQSLPISQNTMLHGVIGGTYGSDAARKTFSLPNLMGRAPLNAGQGEGLSERRAGDAGGAETVKLTEAELPVHTHSLMASNQLATSADPTGRVLARPNYDTGTTLGAAVAYSPNAAGPDIALAPDAMSYVGAGEPHENMQPYLVLNFCISLTGIFPIRP